MKPDARNSWWYGTADVMLIRSLHGWSWFSVTSDFVHTAYDWRHPVCNKHAVYNIYACACLWVWCLKVADILIRLEGSGDKGSLDGGVTELLQADSSRQHPASLCLPYMLLHIPTPAQHSILLMLLYLFHPPILSAFSIFHSALYLCLSASNFEPHTMHTGIHCGLTMASTMQARQ